MLRLIVLLQVYVLCLAIEGPPYQVVNSAETYEERIYPARKWVTTSTLSISHNDATSDMFNKLFNYIDGSNKEGIKIDMTSPVTVLIQPGEGPNCENTFSESFYVPEAHQADPPVPTNPEVYIESRPELHVFTRRFHGRPEDITWIENAAILADNLLAAGEVGVKFETYYTASYDSPFVILNRTNEVWFMQE